MHESPIARQLVAEAVARAGDAGYSRVTRMKLLVGPDGGYVPAALRAHIHAVATGTRAEGATVDITTRPDGGVELTSIEVEEQD